MQSMVDNKRQGMFLVLTEEFRNSCLPYPERIVSSISRHLPKISCSRNEGLLKIIKVRVLILVGGGGGGKCTLVDRGLLQVRHRIRYSPVEFFQMNYGRI